MVVSSQRAPGEEHIPRYPRGFITLRILQLIVGLVCLGLSAYTLAIGAVIGGILAVFTVSPPSPTALSSWSHTY
jgi:hypothetical protein